VATELTCRKASFEAMIIGQIHAGDVPMHRSKAPALLNGEAAFLANTPEPRSASRSRRRGAMQTI